MAEAVAARFRMRGIRKAFGATVAVEAQLAVLLAALVLMLAGERYAAWRWPAGWRRQRRARGWEA